MELFHTSPTAITAIKANGRFGEFLFFSTKEYVMSAGDFVTYKIDLNDDAVIDAGQLFFHEEAAKLGSLVQEIAIRFGVDTDVAESLIDQSESIYDIESVVDVEDMADADWDIQKATARAAKILGFRAVHVVDEQGGAYMIDLLGRESELTIS